MLRTPSKIRLLCRYKFCSFYCLVFSLAGVRPFAFSSPLSSTWLLVGTVFSIAFVPSFFFLSFVRLCFSLGPIWPICSVLVPFCTRFIYYLSVLCHGNTGFVWCFFLRLPSPLHTVYVLFECALPRKHRVCVVPFYSVPFPVCSCFISYPSVLHLQLPSFYNLG